MEHKIRHDIAELADLLVGKDKAQQDGSGKLVNSTVSDETAKWAEEEWKEVCGEVDSLVRSVAISSAISNALAAMSGLMAGYWLSTKTDQSGTRPTVLKPNAKIARKRKKNVDA